MVTIVFESHATTADNEAQLASGWNDVQLSDTGVQQARDLGKRRTLDRFDAVFTSDLCRAYQTAALAFPDIEPRKLFTDWRLRECDYGELTQRPKDIVWSERPQRISAPFPGARAMSKPPNVWRRSYGTCCTPMVAKQCSS